MFYVSPRPLLRLTLFPYTTLFRSRPAQVAARGRGEAVDELGVDDPSRLSGDSDREVAGRQAAHRLSRPIDDARSEEHTSELQSPCNLVCRLLLEKKKETPPKHLYP